MEAYYSKAISFHRDKMSQLAPVHDGGLFIWTDRSAAAASDDAKNHWVPTNACQQPDANDMRVTIPILAALLCASDVTACKLAPHAYDLQAFLAESKDAAVVFAGRVVSVTPGEHGTTQLITIDASRWWRGLPRERVLVAGTRGSMPGTDCEGVFDFTARVGATAFVVGTERSGLVYPSGLLSREENIAKLPQTVEPLR